MIGGTNSLLVAGPCWMDVGAADGEELEVKEGIYHLI